MQKNYVSIIIVNWNGGEILNNCIESIKNNCKKNNYEIIIVDNNSTDNSIELVQEKFDDVIFVKNKTNEGFAKANNIGLLYAKGEFVLLLNSDTMFLDDNITIALDYMRNNPNVSMLSVQLLNSDLSLQENCFKLPTITSYFFEYIFRYRYSQKHDYSSTNQCECISGAYMFIRNNIIEKIGLFDERYYFYQEDTDLCKKFYDNNEVIQYIPYSKVIHIGGSSTKTVKAKMLFQMHKNRYIYVNKYFRSHERILFDVITKVGLLVDFLASTYKLSTRKMSSIDFLNRIRSYKKIFLLGRSF